MGERFAIGISAFHRPTGMLKQAAIKMNALNRPAREFRDLLEKKKEQNVQDMGNEPNIFDLEQEMARCKPSQKIVSPSEEDFFNDFNESVS